MKPALKLLAALCLAQAVGGVQAQRVSVTAIPAGAVLDLAGGGINNFGQVVGRLSNPVDGSSQGFVWSEAAGLRPLGTLGGSYGWAGGINDRGQIVGLASRVDASVVGFIAQPGGPLEALPMLGTVAGINSAGQVLGMDVPPTVAYLYADGLARRVLTSPDNSLQVSGFSDGGDIAGAMRFSVSGPIEPFIRGAATGINTRLFAGYEPLGLRSWKAPLLSPDGRFAAGALGLGASAVGPQAFLWRDGALSLLPGGTLSSTNAVNNAGMVAGWADLRATLWQGGQALDLHALAGLGAGTSSATALNAWGQVVVNHAAGGLQVASLVTLHPDWAGGDGDWATAARWRYGGLDAIALAPGPMHDVLIRPASSATVRGAAAADVRSLTVGGNVGDVVTLDLNGGTTRTRDGTWLAAQSVLTGSGRLAGGLLVDYGARIEVGAGQHLQLSGGSIDHAGALRVSGAGASLEVGGGFTNRPLGEVRVTQASATFAGAFTNEGLILASGSEVAFSGGLANAGAVGLSFGASQVAGRLDNEARGLIVISNGAQASFAGGIANAGELRVSAGGAANFFGVVSGSGRITGGGQARFEGGLTATGAVTVDPLAVLGATAVSTLALDGASELDFSQAVHIEGGALRLTWAGVAGAHAGQQWDLFDWNGGVSGRFDSLQLPTLAPGLRWDTRALYASGEIGISAVPEPGAWLLMGTGLLVLRRRRP